MVMAMATGYRLQATGYRLQATSFEASKLLSPLPLYQLKEVGK
jgi:hypothetical protein